MKKFNIIDFLFEQNEEEYEEQPQEVGGKPGMDMGDEQPTQPQAVPEQPPEQPPEQTPRETSGKSPENRQAFREILGGTISDVVFDPAGSSGGSIKITTSQNFTPLEVSWVGQKVTVTKPDGTIVMLSSGNQQK